MVAPSGDHCLGRWAERCLQPIEVYGHGMQEANRVVYLLPAIPHLEAPLHLVERRNVPKIGSRYLCDQREAMPPDALRMTIASRSVRSWSIITSPSVSSPISAAVSISAAMRACWSRYWGARMPIQSGAWSFVRNAAET